MVEPCNTCPCNCRPISPDCVTQYSEIDDPKILKDNHWRKATDDIEELIGVDCADQLCEDLKSAIVELNDYNENKQPADPEKTIENFLQSKWLNVVTNKYFKKWYANKLLWHWLYGASISELTLSGLVTTSNSDDQYKNNYAAALEKERKRLQDSATFYFEKAQYSFIKYYWDKNTSLYNCIESTCSEECGKVVSKRGKVKTSIL